MKKITLFTGALFALFIFLFTLVNSVQAQQVRKQQHFIPASKFEKYPPATFQYRYDRMGRKTLVTTPFNKDTINVILSKYDPVGNKTDETILTFFKTKNDPKTYVLDEWMTDEELGSYILNFFDQLDYADYKTLQKK